MKERERIDIERGRMKEKEQLSFCESNMEISSNI